MLHIEKKDKKVEKNKTNINLTVIDQNLIIKAVKDYYNEHKIIANLDSIELQELDILQLSYKTILKIQNLNGLAKLTKLQLDNNLIENIQNLDHLKNLKWLDLSFNLIRKIEGLDKLTELQDISLYNNQITQVEGLENCLKLNVFSIGNNKLADFKSLLENFGKTVKQTSKFKNLQVLNVARNPYITTEPNYDQDLIFYIANLKYLDYKYIDDNKRQQIQDLEKYSSEVQQLYGEDSKLKQLQVEDQLIEKYQQEKEYAESGMDKIVNFSDEIIIDQELEKIKILKGVDEEILKFKEKTQEYIEVLKKQIVAECNNKKENEKLFQDAVRAREKESEQETLEKIQEFESKKKVAFKIYEKGEESANQELLNLLDQLQVIKKDMLAIEVELMDDLETAKKNFDDINNFITKTEQISKSAFAKIGEYITKEFNSKISELCKQSFDRYNADYIAQKDLPSLWTEEQITIVENKDNLTQITSSIKEALQQKVYNKEDYLQKFFLNDRANFTNRFLDRQYERNRNNVQNIYNQIDSYQVKFNQMLSGGDSDSDRD